MVKPSQLLKDICALFALLRSRKRWIKKIYARTKSGKICSPRSRLAVCYCLRGAELRVTPEGSCRLDRLHSAIMPYLGNRTAVSFNDARKTRHRDVLKVIKMAKRDEITRLQTTK